MEIAGAARLYVQYQRLQRTGSEAAARQLIAALNSTSENLATIAGMLLVRAGQKSVPVLKAAIAQRDKAMVPCIDVLGGIGGPAAKSVLLSYVSDSDPKVAQAATQGLAVIAMQDKLARGGDSIEL